MVLRVAIAVLEVDAGDAERLEPLRVFGDLERVVGEAVLGIDADRDRQVNQARGEVVASPAWSRWRRRGTPIAAATPRLVVPIALNPAAASAAPDA